MTPELRIDRRGELGQVRDQGKLKTCLSHATSTVHRNIQALEEPLSAETLHYHATEPDFTTGATIPEVQEAISVKGQPHERHCEPICEERSHNWLPPEDVPVFRADSAPGTPSPESVIDTIESHDLPILGISLPDEFFHPAPPWVISSGTPRARHVVVGLGIAHYQGEQIILIRNSWGTEWADGGHAWLDETFLETHLEDMFLLKPRDDQ